MIIDLSSNSVNDFSLDSVGIAIDRFPKFELFIVMDYWASSFITLFDPQSIQII